MEPDKLCFNRFLEKRTGVFYGNLYTLTERKFYVKIRKIEKHILLHHTTCTRGCALQFLPSYFIDFERFSILLIFKVYRAMTYCKDHNILFKTPIHFVHILLIISG
jgi:hypothetical protein